MRVLTKTVGMSREEWLEWRRRGIGASDAAAVCGQNPYCSPMATFLDKIGEHPVEVNRRAAQFGLEVEPIIAKAFTAQTGIRVRKSNAILQHDKYDWMIANVDRLTAPGGIPVELKYSASRKLWEGGVPDMYFLQVQHQMAVTGAPMAYIAAFVAGRRPEDAIKDDTEPLIDVFPIERDDVAIEALITIEERFWTEHVLMRKPPPMDGSMATTDVLNALFGESEPDTILLTDVAKNLAQEYEKQRAEEAKAVLKKNIAGNSLKLLIGTAEKAEFESGGSATWKGYSRSDIDRTRLRREEPDIYEKYLVESKPRRFNVHLEEEDGSA